MIEVFAFYAVISLSPVSIYVAEFAFEQRFHLFGTELMTAEHAIVTHLTVKIHFTMMAVRAR